MKTLLLTIVALAVGLAMASCSDSAVPQPTGAGSPSTAPTPAAPTAAPPPVETPPEPTTPPASSPAAAPPAATPTAVTPPAAPTASAPPAAEPKTVTSAEEAAKSWMISIERAKQLYDAKELEGRQVVFIDARTFLEFRDNGHIRGAMHYAKDYTRGPPQPKVRNYLPGSAVVIYCHGELCTDSIDVGRYFESLKLDIGPIFIIKDGIPAWIKAYPDTIDMGNEVGFN